MPKVNKRERQNWEMWQHRFEAVEGMIEALQESVEESDPRCETFRYLLRNLKVFGRDQFEFFYYGFHPDPARRSKPRLELSKTYPPEFVMRATVDQVAFDLNAIGAILTQRRMAQKGNPAGQKMARTLELADRLAYAALDPACHLLDELGKSTVLTYFQKMGHIRTIPYAEVAIIGVPYTAVGAYAETADNAGELGNAIDLLAIAHEVGHYVYRHAQFAGAAGNKKKGRATDILNRLHVQGEVYQVPPVHNWLEEIFADVYGVYVAGPVMVRDFQDLLLDNRPDKFEWDDGAHPLPAVRPLIYSATLRLMARNAGEGEEWLEAMAEEADRRWLSYQNEELQVRSKALLSIIRPVVKAILKILEQCKPVSTQEMWTRPGTAWADLYSEFTRNLVQDRLGPPVNNIPEPDKTDNIPAYLRTLLARKGLAQKGDEVVKAEIWEPHASMLGWAVHGPENNSEPVVD